jgi:hypothetical protein
MFKNKQVAGGVAIAGVLAFVALLGPTTPLINTASASYGGSSGSKVVTICKDNKTIRVSSRAVATQVANGATRGACLTPQLLVLGASTSTNPELTADLQKQLVTLLQQLLALLQTKN